MGSLWQGGGREGDPPHSVAETRVRGTSVKARSGQREAASSRCKAMGQAGPSLQPRPLLTPPMASSRPCPLLNPRMQEAELWSLLGSREPQFTHLRHQGGPYLRVIMKTRESEGSWRHLRCAGRIVTPAMFVDICTFPHQNKKPASFLIC